MRKNSHGVLMTKCSLCSSVQLDRIINSYFFPQLQSCPTQYNVSGIPKHSKSWRICFVGSILYFTFFSVQFMGMLPSVCLISTMSNPIKKCIYMQSSFYKIPSWNMCEFKQPKKELKVECILSHLYSVLLKYSVFLRNFEKEERLFFFQVSTICRRSWVQRAPKLEPLQEICSTPL